MEEKVTHIGIAVRDARQAALNLTKLFDLENIPLTEYRTSTLHYRIGLLRLGELELELIEPLVQTGMAEEHLRDFGPGVYHIAIAVHDLIEALDRYKNRGFESQEIRKGVHGERVCFLKNHVIPGIYIELVETLKD
jgi:methylmalonyl-CoA/ethylmalonyl-CoA epimerase